jgi:hypothetical protein
MFDGLETMSKLATLRSRLNSLRQRRAVVRWGNAWSALVTALLGLLVAAFVVDFQLEMSRPQRFVSLLFLAGALWWIFQRFTQPFLGQRESELDIALLVEKQQEIDTDLVAALQFESPDAQQWGSATLEQAVIDYVADFGHGMDVFKGFNATQLRRRAATCAVTFLLIFVAVVMYPRHASAFFNRLLLGSRHYPTRTVIEQILVNGQPVKIDGAAGAIKKFPFGQPLKLEVVCTGELPAEGLAKLTTVAQGIHTALKLEPRGRPQSGQQTFAAEQSRLVDSIHYQVFLGDAWTDPATLQVIPLPVVMLELEALPPPYAAKIEQARAEKSGSRQIAVIEGSRVELKLVCSNKALEKATVTVEKQVIPLVSTDPENKIWTLPKTQTPFTQVTTPLRYEVQVKDRDGLGLEQPIVGFVRMKSDRPPRIMAGIISKRILPGAKPKISFGATDDYGIAKVRVLQEVLRANGETEQSTTDVETIPESQQPQTSYKGRYTADFKQLKLAKGDQLKLTLEAIDYRGNLEGKSATSEPLVLEVTDVQGFLAGMVETDEQSARRLDAIIQRQLGIGETQ